MNEYKNVKIALRNFVMARLSLGGDQVFRAPPKATSITHYPAVIIRSATVAKIPINGDGPTVNQFNLVVGILTRAATSEAASDELDDLLQLLDTKIASPGVTGLDASLATGGSMWHNMTRIGQTTTFDNTIEDNVGMVVYGATVGVAILEKTTQVRG